MFCPQGRVMIPNLTDLIEPDRWPSGVYSAVSAYRALARLVDNFCVCHCERPMGVGALENSPCADCGRIDVFEKEQFIPVSIFDDQRGKVSVSAKSDIFASERADLASTRGDNQFPGSVVKRDLKIDLVVCRSLHRQDRTGPDLESSKFAGLCFDRHVPASQNPQCIRWESCGELIAAICGRSFISGEQCSGDFDLWNSRFWH